MKQYILILLILSLGLNFQQAADKDIKQQVGNLVIEYIKLSQKKPMYNSHTGVMLIYVIVLKEIEDRVLLSLNFESDTSAIPYISPNYVMNVNGMNVFIRGVNLSQKLKENLELSKFTSKEDYPELKKLVENEDKEVWGVNRSYYVEIFADSIYSKDYIPASEIKGDLWIYGSDYTKKIHEKELKERNK